MRQPAVVCYKSVDELSQLKDWFYNFDIRRDERERAILRVKAYTSRGKLPHAVEATSHLTSVCLSDPALPSNHVKQTDLNCLQLSYTMALIRFVNGLLDPFQQSTYAIPLYQLAKNLNLPGYFVELRHMGTHEQMPPLDMLRVGARRALTWLYDNYWSRLEEIENLLDNENNDGSNNAVTLVVEELKTIKKIRKQNLDTVYKFGNTTDNGKKYWKSLKRIKNTDKNLLIETLMFHNFLIYNHDKLASKTKFKFNPLLFKLYQPILDELGAKFQFELLEGLITVVEQQEVRIKDPNETVQFQEWILYLIERLMNISWDDSALKRSKATFKDLTATMSRELSRLPTDNRVVGLRKLSQVCQDKLSQEDVKQLETELATVEKKATLESFEVTPSVEDLLSNKRPSTEATPPTKRHKNSNNKPTFFFDQQTNWVPRAFGTTS